jgi:hypothetical protein
LVERCSPWWAAFPCPPWLWGFFLWDMGRRCEVMEVYASGFAGHQGGYFISCESVLGVLTGWRTLWEYQTAGNTKQCSWFPDWGFSANSTLRDRSFCVFD